MWRPAVLAILLAACGAQLGDSAHESPDAKTNGGGGGSGSAGIDAPTSSVSPDAMIDGGMTPACANGRVVYLNFDGVTLTQAAQSDATRNEAAWIGLATATVPPYQAAATNRTQLIQDVITGVTSNLSGFPVTVVTTRPAQGPYVMIVFGGTKTDVGSVYGHATSDHDCGDLVKADVGWVSDTTPSTYVAATTIGTIGWALGLQGSSDPNDCMCGWANGCASSGNACTLGTAELTTTSNSPATTCPGLTTQNEQAAFHTAFCQ